MNLYEAIYVRKSVRNYNMDKLDQNILDNLMNYAGHITMLDEDYFVEYRIIDNTSGIKGAGKGFNIKAPYYLVIESEKKSDYLLNAGYITGQLFLYLASRGYGSCFLGNAKPESGSVSGKDMEVVAVLAFGKAKEPLYRDVRKMKRLKEEQTTIYKNEAGSLMKSIVKAARCAPSSMNNQPWRFVVYDNRIHVFCRKDFIVEKLMNRLKLIDIGIMLSFLSLAAEEQWMDINIRRLDNIADKYFKNNNYVISVLLK